ncbi:DEAD/DEAH box helicase family protein [Marinobacterium arenosum]|uniref:DEAD/DEAH box helicase family protein n=1 Tax=Marinobacterium arenosum TaxID=2862496 RepID=UPI001C958552|nr:DEAD/DEAH box helicase family protein [Marinobacterium arenosum]MBY4675345.1 DEAD/DEAH box helicase family protein [Marinobacterium arenosum]
MNEVCSRLLDGQEDRQLVDALRYAIAEANHIEIAVSFIKRSGLDLIFDDLASAMESGRCKQLSILTSDYLCITDPRALKALMLLVERGADIRVHEVPAGESFHLKAYLFLETEQANWLQASAFIGSSNLSRPALTNGLEWNYRLHWPDPHDVSARQRIEEVRYRFQERFSDRRVKPLSFEWIEAYQQRRKVVPLQYLQPAPEELDDAPPVPRVYQQQAMDALASNRELGKRKGLVVLATGLGKTWLAAFDALQMGAKKVLFIAHREEILLQAQRSFMSVIPDVSSGFYGGNEKTRQSDLLFASVQTLGRRVHFKRFSPDHFDYIVVDEFHHAAAASYQRILDYFEPTFMLGLTATPERGDGKSILALCDDNLVYRMDLFEGIDGGHLVPFHYYGIFDHDVNYAHIPWRSGRFDPDALTAKLATVKRARHALKEWRDRAGTRTLSFCASRKHADFMADQFRRAGVSAAAVYAGSALSRETALAQLEQGELSVLFAVDLFNEGMDLPAIDTIMMLRPTESGILFLQQLGRGLRRSPDKSHLVVLDFVANHQSFLNRPQLLSGRQGNESRNDVIRKICRGESLLPDGCFVNYDLAFIEFLQQISSLPQERDYRSHRESLGRRPSLKEFWQRYPETLGRLRKTYGSWWAFLDQLGELLPEELEVLASFDDWFQDLTISQLSKCFKLVLLHTFIEQQRIGTGATVSELAIWSRDWFLTNPHWQSEISEKLLPLDAVPEGRWRTYWSSNPVKAWTRPERRSNTSWFIVEDGAFRFSELIAEELVEGWLRMSSEILQWRMAVYQQERLVAEADPEKDKKLDAAVPPGQQVPFFDTLRIACGHFRTSSAESATMARVGDGYGRLDPQRHFIAAAAGESMNGGKYPIADGDLLLLEFITPDNAGKISDQIVAIERQDSAGDNQYLLRKVLKTGPGQYLLRANNPDYADLPASEEMMTFARLRAVLSTDEIQPVLE